MKEGQKLANIVQAEWLANYNHQVLEKPHPEWGVCLRFRFGQTTLDLFPAPAAPDLNPAAKLKGTPNQSGKRTIVDIPDVLEVMTTAELQPRQGHGLYLMSQTDEVLINSNGRFYHRHFVEPLKPQESLKPQQEVKANGEPIVTGDVAEPEEKEKQPRVKVTGFFGKVLDGFPRQTDDERTIYKLLIGNLSKGEKRQDGEPKIDWTTVTALEPHVVRFLEQNLDTFEKRKTQLRVEGYYQDVQVQLRRSIKIKQEVYALSIKRLETKQKV